MLEGGDMSVYFDTILDEKLMPLYTGLPKDVKQNVKCIPEEFHKYIYVYVGIENRLLSVIEYISRRF